jgi:hypothetical protein
VTITTSVTNNARPVTKEMGERTILGGDALNLAIIVRMLVLLFWVVTL